MRRADCALSINLNFRENFYSSNNTILKILFPMFNAETTESGTQVAALGA